MPERFKIIVITSPDEIDNEASKITELLRHGVDFVHIRKPGASLRDVKNLIEDIPISLRNRLRLHGHFELLSEFNLAGVQINSRCPYAPRTAISVSKSCHSISELDDCLDYEYVTLSPIYDSISKTGYNSNFNLKEISKIIKNKNIIALGGVTPSEFNELRATGFAGAALLGYIWKSDIAFDLIIKEITEYKKQYNNI